MLCTNCKKKPDCKEVCNKLTKYLKSKGIYSADFIRPERSSHKREDGLGKAKEVPLSSLTRPEDFKKIHDVYGQDEC